MATLETALDPRAPSFLENRGTTLAALSLLDAAHARAREGGGEREVTRHHARGKLLPRERIEMLVDRDTALLELAATAGLGVGETAGAGVVTAIGVVAGVECMVVANDPTVRGAGLSESGRQKVTRAVELAGRHRLPLVFLWESSAEAREVTDLPRVPVISAIFGTFDGPAPLADHHVAVRGQGDLTGVDSAAEDERDALRIVRQAVRRLGARPGRSPLARAALPCHDGDDLLAVTRSQVREVLARVLDGSEFEEIRAHHSDAMVVGFGAVHGCRIAVLGNTGSGLDAAAVSKGLELIRLARMARLPVILLANPADARVEALAAMELARAMAAGADQLTVLLAAPAPAWALVGRGFRFSWPGGDTADEPYDGVIDPRDTRTVLGICLSVLGGRR